MLCLANEIDEKIIIRDNNTGKDIVVIHPYKMYYTKAKVAIEADEKRFIVRREKV